MIMTVRLNVLKHLCGVKSFRAGTFRKTVAMSAMVYVNDDNL